MKNEVIASTSCRLRVSIVEGTDDSLKNLKLQHYSSALGYGIVLHGFKEDPIPGTQTIDSISIET